MNWFGAGREGDGDGPGVPAEAGSSQAATTPDAQELRRRRLAKLEAAAADEKARRKDLEERKAKWEAEKAAKEALAPKPSPKPSIPTVPIAPEPAAPPPPRRAPPPLASLEVMESATVSNILGLAGSAAAAQGSMVYVAEFIADLRAEAALAVDEPLRLSADLHADDVLINRINAVQDPLGYLLACFQRCVSQRSEMLSNRRLEGEEHRERRAALSASIAGVERRVLMYTGMLLNGSFMETDNVKPEAFAELILENKLPGGFLSAFLACCRAEDGPGLEEVLPIFSRVFKAIRYSALTDMKLSSRNFLRPLKALTTLLGHKELCRLLAKDPSFVPKGAPGMPPLKIQIFSLSSYLCPFFKVSALPGLPLHQPTLTVEDPSIGPSHFPDPSMISQTEAEGAIIALRSSLSVARAYLHQICLALCRAGPDPRNAMLDWFATVFNLNKKRSAMQVDYQDVSGDGFMLNVMHVLLKMCDPIVAGGWKMLEKIDPTYPQSTHRIDYTDETRLAADSDMLRRWWVDRRNANAQDSLTRQLEATARESGITESASAAGSSRGEDSEGGEDYTMSAQVSKDFSFVSECFWLALRSVQLGFIPVTTMYEETLLRSLSRLRGMIRDMEGAAAIGSLPPDQAAQLSIFKARFDSMLQTKLCYDVYLMDTELLTALVQFVTADAEWLVKKLLCKPERESLLPLPLPPQAVFASLPEHTVETITTVLLTAMHYQPHIVDENSALLDDIVTFCIAGSASPLHLKNPYLRAKLIEFLWTIFPRPDDDDGDAGGGSNNPIMAQLFSGHELARKFLPSALFRLYVDVEHTGSHTQFYDKFSIRFRIGSIIESLWHMPDYRRSVQQEAGDEVRFLRFVNMLLNDANHLLDSVLNDLEEMHALEEMINGNSVEWLALTDEEKREKQDQLSKLQGSAKSYNQLANNNVKLLWLLTDDEAVRKVFLRAEMVSRLAEMLNYLLDRLCGQRCRDLKVSDKEKVAWKPRQLLTRIMETYLHFHGNKEFAAAIGRDGRSYKAELFVRAIGIASRRRLLVTGEVARLKDVGDAAAEAYEEDHAEEDDLGDIPDEFMDPIMSSIMRDPVLLPTSGSIVDRAVISRILLSDKSDPFNRQLLTEDMLEPDTALKGRIMAFIAERRAAARAARAARSS